MSFMSSQNVLRSDFVIEVEVGEVGGIGGSIESVLMKAERPDHVFLEGDIVRNMYWLGFLGYF